MNHTKRPLALEITEAIQKKALLDKGVKEDQLLEYLHQRTRNKIMPSASDLESVSSFLESHDLEKILESVKSYERHTLYQCPISKLTLDEAWRKIQEAPFIENLEGHKLGSAFNPFILSADTGRLNCSSISASDNTHSIIIEDEFINLSSTIAPNFCKFFSIIDNDNPSGLNDYINKGLPYLHQIFNIFLGTVMHGSVNDVTINSKFSLDPGDENLREALNFNTGYLSFLLGHEWSHITITNDIEGRNLENLCAKSPDSLENIKEKYINKYSTFFDSSDIENFYNNFLGKQSNELFCDLQGIQTHFYNLITDPENESMFFKLLGAIWALLSSFILEGSIRYIIGGKNFALGHLWLTDNEVDDFFLRTSHPSAITRLNFIFDQSLLYSGYTNWPHEKELVSNIKAITEMITSTWCQWINDVKIPEGGVLTLSKKWQNSLHYDHPIGPSFYKN